MPIRLALGGVLPAGVLVIDLTALNTDGISVNLGPGWTHGLPLIVGTLLAGAALVLVLRTVRDAGRSYRDYRCARRARRDEMPPESFPPGAELHLVGKRAGDTREALRVWERALDTQPVSPLLSRIEHLYRADGRPARMIALYKEAAVRHPDNHTIAFGRGRVHFGLAMLDEAVDRGPACRGWNTSRP